jgi:glycine oxidase
MPCPPGRVNRTCGPRVYNTHMGMKPDVLVIGGGIIGLTSAYYLAKAGLSVEVIDRGDLGREASWAGAGIIPPGNPQRAAKAIDRLRAVGSDRFPSLSAELAERTGIDNGYVRCGGVEFLRAEDEYALDLWHAEGIPYRKVGAEELRRLEPNVEPLVVATAYLLDSCAQVRNPWHLRALIAACERVGVRLVAGAGFAGWDMEAGSVRGVRTRSGTTAAGWYLIAAGAWSEELLAPLGCRPGVHPVRGQIVLFRSRPGLISRVLMAGKHYLVPRPDGRILAGSTEEPEAGFEKANTPEGVKGLIDFAGQLVPRLADAEVEKTWAGLRPGSPDGLPYIGPVPGHAKVLVAAGHFRAGVQLSIGTAEIVRDLITGKEPAVSIDAFRPDREPEVTAKPAFRS